MPEELLDRGSGGCRRERAGGSQLKSLGRGRNPSGLGGARAQRERRAPDQWEEGATLGVVAGGRWLAGWIDGGIGWIGMDPEEGEEWMTGGGAMGQGARF